MSAYEKQAGGDHYKGFAIQPGEYCHKNKLGNYESYAIKYITRYDVKWKDNLPKQLEDLNKAIHCLELLKTELSQQPKDYNETIIAHPSTDNPFLLNDDELLVVDGEKNRGFTSLRY